MSGLAAPERLAEALAQLTAHQRLVLLLRFEAGLALREVAELLADAVVLGGSVPDVHPALYRQTAGPHLRGTDLTRHLRDLTALRRMTTHGWTAHGSIVMRSAA